MEGGIVPSLELMVQPTQSRGWPVGGDLSLQAAPSGLQRVPLRHLAAMIRCHPHSGAYPILMDTGAPLSVFPFDLWSGRWSWQVGRDFDELSVVGIGGRLGGRVAGLRYTGRLVRTRVSVELRGTNIGPRLRLDTLIVQLADPGGPTFPLFGLWGNAIEGRSIHVTRQPGSDDLAARLDY